MSATTKTPLGRYDTGPHTSTDRRTTPPEVVVRSRRRRRRREITRRSLSLAEAATRMIVGKLPVASLYRPSLLETRRDGPDDSRSRVCMRLTVLSASRAPRNEFTVHSSSFE